MKLANFIVVSKWTAGLADAARQAVLGPKAGPRRSRNWVALVASSFLLAAFLQAAPNPGMQGEGFRFHEVGPAGAGRTGFTRLGPEITGVTFTNEVAETVVALNRIVENGAGVALGDVDGDGWCDLYLAGLSSRNRLYRNLGNWKFEDITEHAGVACEGQLSTGVVFADVDGDGRLDLLVNGIGAGTRLFMNQGQALFRERADSGLVRRGGSHSLGLADADGDGDLDLYVTNYRTTTFKDRPAGETRDVRIIDGKPVVKPADRWTAFVTQPPAGVTLIELGEPDVYYRNDGKGQFEAVSWTDGTFTEDGRPLPATPREWGLSVLFRDLTGDGMPDLYVCNDFYYSRDRVWINDGRGRFKSMGPMCLRSMCETSMAADVSDINRDGLDDLLVMDMLPRTHLMRQTRWDNMWKQVVPGPIEDPAFSPEYPRNMLFLNRGDGTWTEIARLAGIEDSGWSWSALFLDVDLDGFDDILVTTGHGRDMLHADVVRSISSVPPGSDMEGRLRLSRRYPSLPLANLAFHNRGDLTFNECAKEWGFDTVSVSQGFALADLDNDGDLDVVINQYRDAAGLYRNDSPAPRVAVRLLGQPPNTQGIGARVRVKGGPVPQSAEMVSGGRYLSADAPARVFAAGSTEASLEIDVTWRSGKVSRITGARANRIYEIQEPATRDANQAPLAEAPPGASSGPPLFEDVTKWLQGHTHSAAPFNDDNLQPLLPRRLSEAGPGIGWFDLNRDGWDELIVSGGRSGAFTVFDNKEGRAFERVPGPTLPSGQAGLLGWMSSARQPLLLAANSQYEDWGKNERPPAVRLFDPRQNRASIAVEKFPNDVGPLALGDYDADGDLDLFIGGRLVPGRYPQAASSRLYQNDAGTFTLNESASTGLDQIGLVNGALFSDLNGDGYPDLILACEWGPIRVFGNVRGRFVEQTKALGLEEHTGLWQGVATADFNGDGQLDLIASNWGRNGEFQPSPGRPATLWAGDLDGRGAFQVIEAEWDDARADWAPRRNLDAIAAALPWVRGDFATVEAFGKATVAEIFGKSLTNAVRYEAATLETSVFLAKAGRFERHALPIEAQFSAAFGVAAGDFDGDGREDAFLAQNFFPVAPDRSRQDAGLGLLLLGDGKGSFRPVPAAESGVRIFGEQRGCAVADFDGDGRLDLAVAQNRGVTRLFRNQGGSAALRVRLQGTAGNIEVIGTQLAPMISDKRRGLIREVRSGSGYWSQDSAVALVPSPDPVRQLWLRWPRGRQITVAVPDGSREILVNGMGEVKRLR